MSGYIDSILYCIFTAISFVLIDKLDNAINPYLSLLVMSLIATGFFVGINYKNLNHMWRASINNKQLYLIINLIIAINWICSIFAPNIADPFIYLSVNFIVQAILGVFYMNDYNKYFLYFIETILLSLIVFILLGYSIVHGKNIIVGIIFGLFGGVSQYLYGVFSTQLAHDEKLTPSQVLGIRFVFLIIVLSLIVFSSTGKIKIALNYKEIMMIVFMGFISLVIPVYYMQSAYKKIGVMRSSVIFGFVPGITFLIYSIFSRHFVWLNFIIALIITATILMVKFLPGLIYKGKKF